MSDPMKQAWNDVGDSFATLGRVMKARYKSVGQGEADDDTTKGSSQDGAALRQAFDRLVAAGREFGDRAADVARDDDVKAQTKRAAASLNHVLSATVDLIGEQVGGLFQRPDQRASAPEVATPEPPAKPVS